MYSPHTNQLISSVYFFKYIYFERGRWGQRESQAGSLPSAQSPTWGSNARTVRSCPEPKFRVRRLTDGATQVPLESCQYLKDLYSQSQVGLKLRAPLPFLLQTSLVSLSLPSSPPPPLPLPSLPPAHPPFLSLPFSQEAPQAGVSGEL